MTTALVALALLAAAWLAAFLPYRLREPAARGRPALVALRTGSLFLLALLLWNPDLPREAPPDPQRGGDWVLLDRSLGMTARSADGTSAWERAVERVRERRARGARVAVYDRTLEVLEAPGLDRLEPGEPGSRLAPGLEGVLEAGASGVEVVSDFRIDDGDRILELGGLVPEGVGVRPVGETVRNVGVAAFEAPSRAEAGEAVEVTLHLHGEGVDPGDSLRVRVEEAGEPLAEARVPAPVGAGTAAHSLSLPAFEEEGLRRLEAVAELDGDGFPHDDRRVAYVRVEDERRGIVLVALDPGWEGRQLLPVLERATDLAGEGYLRLGARGYLPLRTGEPAEALETPGEPTGGPLDPATVGERLEEARIAVILGLGADPPDEVAGALEEASGLLVFPGEVGGGTPLGLEVTRARPGEWRAAEELPSSRLAGDLAGVDFSGLPPVEGVLEVEVPAAAEVALLLESGGGAGPRLPGLLLEARGDRRLAVAPARGFWRWAARGGEARETYRRLWSAVGGELLRAGEPDDPVAAPEDRVVERGAPVRWRAVGAAGGDVRVEVRAGNPAAGEGSSATDEVVLDSVLAADADGRFTTPPLPPGPYRYALATADGEELGEGPFDVDPYAADLERPPRPPDPAVAEGVPGPVEAGAEEEAAPRARAGEAPAGAPVRTRPWPYLLALALLCVEWVVRRRVGLR